MWRNVHWTLRCSFLPHYPARSLVHQLAVMMFDPTEQVPPLCHTSSFPEALCSLRSHSGGTAMCHTADLSSVWCCACNTARIYPKLKKIKVCVKVCDILWYTMIYSNQQPHTTYSHLWVSLEPPADWCLWIVEGSWSTWRGTHTDTAWNQTHDLRVVRRPLHTTHNSLLFKGFKEHLGHSTQTISSWTKKMSQNSSSSSPATKWKGLWRPLLYITRQWGFHKPETWLSTYLSEKAASVTLCVAVEQV